MKILVCGGRKYNNISCVFSVLDGALKKYPDMELIAGGATGADYLADEWADSRYIPFHRFPARWSTHGKAAGCIRNQKMLTQNPGLVIAFPGGTGTAHMVKISKEAGVKVIEVPFNASSE